MQLVPRMLITVLTFRVGPVGFLRALPWAQPREDPEISDPERIKSQQVSKWILGTHSRGDISLKIKIFLTWFDSQETNPEGLCLNGFLKNILLI